MNDETGAPNLDAMATEDLWAFWMLTNSVRPVAQARAIFPTRPSSYVRAFKSLGAYACNKATAMECRLRGDIQTASLYETICDHIYATLPAFARW